MPGQTVTAREAARMLDVTTQAIHYRVKRGSLPAIEDSTPGGRRIRRFALEDVQRLAELRAERAGK
ncbi:MAG TPA: helix-turn-helix domain-containing protein [Thermohalobaculum sp.]|nr:helix-turn-helix domain-containing protein [Thermohalobaculum sp.]